MRRVVPVALLADVMGNWLEICLANGLSVVAALPPPATDETAPALQPSRELGDRNRRLEPNEGMDVIRSVAARKDIASHGPGSFKHQAVKRGFVRSANGSATEVRCPDQVDVDVTD